MPKDLSHISHMSTCISKRNKNTSFVQLRAFFLWNGACYVSFLLSQLSPPCPFFCQTCGCSPIFSQHQWISGKILTGNHGLNPHGFSLKKIPDTHGIQWTKATVGAVSEQKQVDNSAFCNGILDNYSVWWCQQMPKNGVCFTYFLPMKSPFTWPIWKIFCPKDSFEECFSWLGSIYIHLSSFSPFMAINEKLKRHFLRMFFFLRSALRGFTLW